MLWGIVLTHAGGSMRVSSSRAATAAALLAGLGVLVVVGRLLPTTPSTRHPTTAAATGATSAPAIRTAPGNTRGYAVPDVLGRTLAQAKRVMRVAGLQGAASDRDPQGPTAVVVAQEPPAGVLVPPGSVIGFRTMTDVQSNNVPRRLRLGGGPTTATYRVVASDPAHHQLRVVVAVPRAADVAVWLEAGPGQLLPVLDSTRDTTTCQPTRGQVRCVVRFGALEAEAPGVWTVSVANHSALPAAITVTLKFTPV
jgi:PASTA domain